MQQHSNSDIIVSTSIPKSKAEFESGEFKPVAIIPAGIPHAMIEIPAWSPFTFTWVEKRNTADGTPQRTKTKILKFVTPSGRMKYGSSKVSERKRCWSTYDRALAIHQHEDKFANVPTTHGIGFITHADAGITCVDLDDAIDTATGLLRPWARAIVERLPTYGEISPSGTGIKLFLYGRKPRFMLNGELKTKSRAKGLVFEDGTVYGVEIYDEKQFVAVTGNRYPGLPADVIDCQVALNELWHEIFPPEAIDPEREAKAAAARTGIASRAPLPQDEISRRMFASKSGPDIQFLWDDGNPGSEGDLALASHIVWWFGPDASLIESLMRQSGRYRDKWDTHATYLVELTIGKAIAGASSFYGDGSRHHDDDLGLSAADLASITIIQPPRPPTKCGRCREIAVPIAGGAADGSGGWEPCACERDRSERAARQAAKRKQSPLTRPSVYDGVGNDGTALMPSAADNDRSSRDIFSTAELDSISDAVLADRRSCQTEFVTPEIPDASVLADYFTRSQSSTAPTITACPCRNPRNMFMRKLDGSSLHMMVKLRCKSWECLPCGQTLRKDWTEHISQTLRTWHKDFECEQFYTAPVVFTAWPTIHKSFTRCGAFHIRIEEHYSGVMQILTTAANKLPNATAISLAQAIKLTSDLIRDGDFGPKSITLTQGWGMNTAPKKPPQFEMVAECPEMSNRTLFDLLSRNGIDTEDLRWKAAKQFPGSRVIGRLLFSLPFNCSDDDRKYLYRCLQNAEMVLRDDEWDGVEIVFPNGGRRRLEGFCPLPEHSFDDLHSYG